MHDGRTSLQGGHATASTARSYTRVSPVALIVGGIQDGSPLCAFPLVLRQQADLPKADDG